MCKTIADGKLPPLYWDEIYESHRIWLSARSAGLLEFKRFRHTIRYDDEVAFVHRSAREFLLGTPDGTEILSFDSRTSKEKWLALAKALRSSEFIHLSTSTAPISDPRNDNRFLVARKICAGLRLNTLNDQRLAIPDSGWIVPPCQRVTLAQSILERAADAGDVVVFSEHKEILFDDLTQRGRNRLLFKACELKPLESLLTRSGAPNLFCSHLILDDEDTDMDIESVVRKLWESMLKTVM